MRTTIKAKAEYHIYNIKNSTRCILTDGDTVLFEAIKTTKEDYEYNRDNNECFKFMECFKTAKGTTAVYWIDTEFNIDYISIIK